MFLKLAKEAYHPLGSLFHPYGAIIGSNPDKTKIVGMQISAVTIGLHLCKNVNIIKQNNIRYCKTFARNFFDRNDVGCPSIG
jgi:hypothetical protein